MDILVLNTVAAVSRVKPKPFRPREVQAEWKQFQRRSVPLLVTENVPLCPQDGQSIRFDSPACRWRVST